MTGKPNPFSAILYMFKYVEASYNSPFFSFNCILQKLALKVIPQFSTPHQKITQTDSLMYTPSVQLLESPVIKQGEVVAEVNATPVQEGTLISQAS